MVADDKYRVYFNRYQDVSADGASHREGARARQSRCIYPRRGNCGELILAQLKPFKGCVSTMANSSAEGNLESLSVPYVSGTLAEWHKRDPRASTG
jgi:hypothetical protein